MRNGRPIEGSPAFAANAGQHGDYPGYRMEGDMENGRSVTIPEDYYYAMGDNSKSSLDSRYWGCLHKSALIGKPLIIFYPFTERWGAAK
jgi:signal peptidase I